MDCEKGKKMIFISTIILTAIFSSSALTYLLFPRYKTSKKVHLSTKEFNSLHALCITHLKEVKKPDHLNSINYFEIKIGNTTYKRELI